MKGLTEYMNTIFFCSEYDKFKEKFKSKRLWRTDGVYEPFVYVVQENDTGRFYIGSRTAYSGKKCLESDLGKIYFTSSGYIKPIWSSNIEKFTIVSISKCASNHDAYILELMLCDSNNAIFSDSFLNKGHPTLGFDVSGVPKSEEHRNKIGSSKRSWYESLTDLERGELKEKNRIGQILRFEDPKEKEKISISIKQKIRDDESYRQKMKDNGRHISDLHKSGHYNDAYKKISEANSGKKKPDGFGEKISESRKGWNPSEETRSRMSDARKGKYTGEDNIMSNPVSRKKVSASKIGRKRVNKKDGTFMYVKPNDLERYHKHKDNKYYDFPE